MAANCYPASRTVAVLGVLGILVGVITAAPSQGQEQWEPRKILELGVVGGDPTQEFLSVADVEVLEDSVIVVASAGTADVRLFTLQGRLQASWGREGAGPREFGWIAPDGVYVRGDTIVVVDGRLQRATVLLPDGSLVRTVPFSGAGFPGQAIAEAVLEDGTLVLRGIAPSQDRGGGWEEPVAEIRIWHPEEGLRLARSLPWGREYIVVSTNADGVTGVGGWTPPGSAVGHIAPAGRGRFWYSDGVRPVLQLWNITEDSLERTVDVAGGEGDVVDPDWNSILEEWVRGLSAASRRWIEIRAVEFEAPDSFPRGPARLIPDRSDGSVWYTLPQSTRASGRMWYQVNRNGRHVASVTLPDGFQLLGVHRDLLVGRSIGVMDVEQVVVFELPESF